MVHTNYCSKMISSIQNTSFVDFCSSFSWSFAFVLIKNISKNQHHKTGNLWEVNILFVENLLLLMLASKEASFTGTLHEDHEKSPLNEIRKHIMCGILKKCAPSTINRMIYVDKVFNVVQENNFKFHFKGTNNFGKWCFLWC